MPVVLVRAAEAVTRPLRFAAFVPRSVLCVDQCVCCVCGCRCRTLRDNRTIDCLYVATHLLCAHDREAHPQPYRTQRCGLSSALRVQPNGIRCGCRWSWLMPTIVLLRCITVRMHVAQVAESCLTR